MVMQRLGARFDIDRIESALYGIECWTVFFEAVDARALAPAVLYEGDSLATLSGLEKVFICAMATLGGTGFDEAKHALAASPRFRECCAAPMFVEGEAAAAEPLVLAGQLSSGGDLLGDAWNARPAFERSRGRREDSSSP